MWVCIITILFPCLWHNSSDGTPYQLRFSQMHSQKGTSTSSSDRKRDRLMWSCVVHKLEILPPHISLITYETSTSKIHSPFAYHSHVFGRVTVRNSYRSCIRNSVSKLILAWTSFFEIFIIVPVALLAAISFYIPLRFPSNHHAQQNQDRLVLHRSKRTCFEVKPWAILISVASETRFQNWFL